MEKDKQRRITGGTWMKISAMAAGVLLLLLTGATSLRAQSCQLGGSEDGLHAIGTVDVAQCPVFTLRLMRTPLLSPWGKELSPNSRGKLYLAIQALEHDHLSPYTFFRPADEDVSPGESFARLAKTPQGYLPQAEQWPYLQGDVAGEDLVFQIGTGGLEGLTLMFDSYFLPEGEPFSDDSLELIQRVPVTFVSSASGEEPLRGQLIQAAPVVELTMEELFEHLESLTEKNDSILWSASGIEAQPHQEAGSWWSDLIDKIKAYAKYLPGSATFIYYTQNAHGEKIKVSGLVTFPVPFSEKTPFPILSVQHPTQVERQYSPSEKQWGDPELAMPLAMAMATTGYIVVMADYPGMGVNYDPHPYCHESLAYSVIDMIRAARDKAANEDHPLNPNVEWDERLYLMGYSEGGYATLVSAKELQLNHAGEFQVSAVAGLDGPYSLSDTMRNLMIDADADFLAPYFLPYVVEGYDSVYADQYEDLKFTEAVKESVPDYTPPEGSTYALELRKLLDGSHPGSDINAHMKLATPYVGPKSILTQEYLDNLEKQDSNVYRVLEENDAFGGWVPSMPLTLFHNVDDDLVPFGNARNAYDGFVARGAGDNVQLEPFEAYIALPDESIHAGAFPVALFMGFDWIDEQAFPERH